jgi:hypothetical protein
MILFQRTMQFLKKFLKNEFYLNFEQSTSSSLAFNILPQNEKKEEKTRNLFTKNGRISLRKPYEMHKFMLWVNCKVSGCYGAGVYSGNCFLQGQA